MLEIICAGSLTLFTKINSCPQIINPQLPNSREISQVLPDKFLSSSIYLTKGRPYKSRYREEADQYQGDHERRNHDFNNHRDVNRVEVRDGRIYRDADYYRQESDTQYERSRDDRNYRNTEYNHHKYEFYPRSRDSNRYLWRGNY